MDYSRDQLVLQGRKVVITDCDNELEHGLVDRMGMQAFDNELKCYNRLEQELINCVELQRCDNGVEHGLEELSVELTFLCN